MSNPGSPPKWISLGEAIRRAGSGEALLAFLRERPVPARARDWLDPSTGRRKISGMTINREDQNIPFVAWPKCTRLENNKAYFATEDYLTGRSEVMAVGVELDGAEISAKFPEPATVEIKPKSTGGRPRDHDWDGALVFAGWRIGTYGRPETKAALFKAIKEWFEKVDGGAPDEREIMRRVVDKAWSCHFT